MDKLMLSDWVAIVSSLGMILAIVVSITTLVSKSKEKSASDAELRVDIKYIRENVDSTNKLVKSLDEKIGGIDTRLARVEESAKSAHKRIDNIETKICRGD